MRILVRAHKSPFLAASAERTLSENLIGGNVGNLVFGQATYRMLWRDGHEISRLSRLDADRVNNEVDLVVLPLANAFRRSFLPDLDALSRFLEKLTIPVVVLGVGAQVRLDRLGNHDAEVDAAAQRFITAALHRSPSIGVRGEFSRDYLLGLGFDEDTIDVIGCPSMFMYGPDLPPLRTAPHLTVDHRIAFNASPYRKRIGPLSMRAAEVHPQLVYFAQDVRTLNLLLKGVYPGRTIERTPVTLQHPLIRDDRVLMCLDPDTWMRELAGFDYSFGTRIHGNIAALLSGTPATVISHDSRTRELAEYHCIPHVPLTKINARTPAPELYAQSDWRAMHRAHPERWSHFETFLTTHGLRHAFGDGGRLDDFDRRLEAVNFPPPVRTLRSAPLEQLYAYKRAAAPPRWRRAGPRVVRWARGRGSNGVS